jgi:ATP phosphoribosyltransferase regulatory subunit
MHPLPSGTRDVLPEEMDELRALTGAMRATFADLGYGEVHTPAIEYETAVGRLDGGAGVYRLFDDHGAVLRLRSDLTVPIARVAATRYAGVEPPLRFCAFAHVWRGVRPHRGQMREELQAGCELVGASAPDGTAEVLTTLVRVLEAVGLRDFRIALGDAALHPLLFDALDVPAPRREALRSALVARDLVALAGAADGLDPLVADVPGRRGGVEVLDGVPGGEGLAEVHAALAPAVAERVIFDLGLARDPDYYTGAIFDVLAPGIGTPLGGGGRYDELLGRLGRPLPAVGFALGVDAVHAALAAEERAAREVVGA